MREPSTKQSFVKLLKSLDLPAKNKKRILSLLAPKDVTPPEGRLGVIQAYKCLINILAPNPNLWNEKNKKLFIQYRKQSKKRLEQLAQNPPSPARREKP